MLKALEIHDTQSCLNRAAPDEPIFVLRAKDPLAPLAVRYWASMSRALHGVAKTDSAFAEAAAMEVWRKANID